MISRQALTSPSASLHCLRRPFSSTPSAAVKSSAARLEHLHRNIPPYPYGPSQWFKQSNFGLYGGTHIQFGNIVSERNEIKTRRKWKPNIQSKRLWSDALQRYLRIRVSTRALRTIDKVGGLDEYLLGEKAARIKELGMGGWLLRWRIMQTPRVKARYAEERRRLGLPERVETPAVDEVQMKRDVSAYDGQMLDQSEDVVLGDEAEEAEEGFMAEESGKEHGVTGETGSKREDGGSNKAGRGATMAYFEEDGGRQHGLGRGARPR